MSLFDLRAARSTDAGKLGAILSDFVDKTAWMPRLHTRAEDISFAGSMIDKGWVTVALSAQHICGFCARDGADIHALYVDARLQGQGCGSALLDQMKTDSDTLDLWTFQANARAQEFYTARGFVELTRTDGADTDEGLPDIRYRWQAEGREE